MAKTNIADGLDYIEHMDPDELDSVRALLAYVLMRSTDMDGDEIYDLVFQEGKKITWH
ncbi:MAG: hypothetical protein Kow0025_10800 [Thermodesulfovibrionales bacterium]